LEDYDGTILFITHDRALIKALAEMIWWVEDGRSHIIDGGYDALTRWLEARRGPEMRNDDDPATKVHRRADHRARQRSDGERVKRQLTKQLEQLEAQMTELQAHKENLERRLADPSVYDDPDE